MSGLKAVGPALSPVRTKDYNHDTLYRHLVILLSTASQGDGGSLLPLPGTLKAPRPVIAKSIASPLLRGLVEEREVSDQASVHRSDGDLRYGMFITDARRSAIGAGDHRNEQSDAVTAPSRPVRIAKSAIVIALLQRADGATMPALIAATVLRRPAAEKAGANLA